MAVNIHQNHNPAMNKAVAGGTKMIKNSSLMNIAAVLITATANLSLL